jgi:hypothetical protein
VLSWCDSNIPRFIPRRGRKFGIGANITGSPQDNQIFLKTEISLCNSVTL